MTHTLSSIIDLTNAPAPPRWFEFLLEPGRLQQHLETPGCDPSPMQLITLFFRNIPNLETTSAIPSINIGSTSTGTITATTTTTTATTATTTPTATTTTSATPTSNSDATNGTQVNSSTTNGNSSTQLVENNETSNNCTIEGGEMNNKVNDLTEKIYNEFADSFDVVIPPNSYEAKYRIKKTYALQILAIKVASFLKWDLDVLCNGLTIPVQCKLMQALKKACSPESCPVEVKKFASVMYSHWFLRSAISYKLSTLQSQPNSTPIIYLSQLQQQQQAADALALLSMGELFSETSKQSKSRSSELHDYIWELTHNKDNRAKRHKGSNHPFKKAKLRRPMMDCFDSRDEQFNDWDKCETIEALEFIEAACYDLGRFFFFEESYALAEESFETIRGLSSRFPLIDEYLQSATNILTTEDRLDEDDPSSDVRNCDKLTNELSERREITEKYLFDCMTQFQESQSKIDQDAMNLSDELDLRKDHCRDVAVQDTDLRFNNPYQEPRPPEGSGWYMRVPSSQIQQQLLNVSEGDMLMSKGYFKQAMGCFVGALMLMTDYFRSFSKSYLEEEPYISRMIQCSITLSCFTQAVALCQMTKSLNYTMAFKQLNERVCNDCCDDIYECIWNVTLLEYIINLHTKRGEVERRTKVIQLIGQLELNENNPDEILREAEHVRRGRFFRIMSNKYL